MPENMNGRFINAVCDKVGQMTPGMMNVLAIRSEDSIDLAAAMVGLRIMAEHKDELFSGARGLRTWQIFTSVPPVERHLAAGKLWRISLAK